MTSESVNGDAATAHARSVVYSFLAAVFSFPEPQWIRDIARAACACDTSQLLRRAAPTLTEPFERIRAEFVHVADDIHNESAVLQSAYTELLGHTVRGTCPAYELEYGHSDILQQASDLADICGFYHAFGMTLVTESHERADHITVECEFMSVLTAKQLYAIEAGDDEAQQILLDAQCSFLNDHLSRWSPAWSFRLHRAAPEGFYGRAAMFLGDFIRTETARFEIPCGPELLELQPAEVQRDAQFECGVEESCPGAAPASTTGAAGPLVQVGIDRG